MPGEAEVIVRPQHDYALAVDHRLIALVVVEGLVEGVEAEAFAVLGSVKARALAKTSRLLASS
jgi:hypothetical protein